jgi:hypothetical protein
MSDDAVPAIKPSLPEAQPMIPQPLVELHGWGRASGTMTHLAQIDSVADAYLHYAPPIPSVVWYRADSAAATATQPRMPAAPHWTSPK